MSNLSFPSTYRAIAFDQGTRNRLQRFVNETRKLLEEEFTRQLQNDYGLDPVSGSITPIENLRHLNDSQRETARILRETLSHYCAGQTSSNQTGIDRIVREQAFTVLNRLAALRMAEARGLLIESVGNGYQAKGFQLYLHLVGTGLGETGDAYRNYLFSIFDELSLDLPSLFARYSPQGRLFPRESALLQVISLINDPEIEALWGEDETIGWIYQYFNSKEERKAMRDASQAPRNSRELAVRNQFFTPRYVVEFLVDNTLGRLWFNATGGQTQLQDRCQYLLVKPNEEPQAAPKLRDPRTIKLLDPACGSMHFGLYAFDLFIEIYSEAWDWEQQNGPGSLDISTQPSANLQPLAQTYTDKATFLRDVPRLIIEHNIYGVDIDPRAAQIASLALWLRAQRAWHQAGIKRNERPFIGRGHVVAAIAPPAEQELQDNIIAELDPVDAKLFEMTLQLLRGLPELGILLQVEKDLLQLIRQVYGEHGPIFNESDLEKWQVAESRLHMALERFSNASKTTYQGRLFAYDALEGLKLIDLTREKFDVVVMNPPFGTPSVGSYQYIAQQYPLAKGDLLAVFVERALGVLRVGGRVGAITNRSCFFLKSMEDWRKDIVLTRSHPEALVDLGAGVMDDAMVEAAAYVLKKIDSVELDPIFTCIRALTDTDKRASILDAISGNNPFKLFFINPKAFKRAPSHAFTYWIPESILHKLFEHNSIEKELVHVRVGMQTGDDKRFLRQWWEVNARTLASIKTVNDTQGDARELALRGQGKWFTYTKTDESSPWFSPLLQVVKWYHSGEEYKHFVDSKGKSRAALRSQEYYLQAGFSYMNRSSRLVPYIFPAGAIPSAGRSQAFGEGNNLFDAYVIAASNIGSASARFTGESFARPKYQAGMVQSMPAVKFQEPFRELLRQKLSKEYALRRRRFEFEEPYREFLIPRALVPECPEYEWSKSSLLGEELELQVASQYGLSDEEYKLLELDLREAVTCQLPEEDEADDDDLISLTLISKEDRAYKDAEGLVSYAVGCVFGRWDILKAIHRDVNSTEIDPFAPLPLSPPGMLQDEHGLPTAEIQPDWEYPIKVCQTGIIELCNGGALNLTTLVGEVFDIILPICEIDEHLVISRLKIRSLDEYLRQPGKFFTDHLLRYTAGGRKAPIYWPLSTNSGSYTIWLYYPTLSTQTLYTVINDYVEPKLKQITEDVAILRGKSSARSREDEKHFESLQVFELELIELRDTLLKNLPQYQPNHDDGVQITAAPLWPLFRHKQWQKVLKDTWGKLEKGDYDWSHLAMSYWPDRVREKCKTDKSLAIAHGLEELYVEPVVKAKKGRGKSNTGDME